eukprot:Em0009g167a
MAAGYLGMIEAFDPATEEWGGYIDRFQQFLVVNDVKDPKKQAACLITVIGASTYKLLENLLSPEKPATKKLDELIEVLQHHFQPKVITIAERFKFHQRSQADGKSVVDYMAKLRHLASTCDFGRFLDQALRDRLVCGLRNAATQKRLLAEADLTLNRAVEIAQGMEIAERNTQQIQSAVNGASIPISPTTTEVQAPVQAVRRFNGRSDCHHCNGKHEPSKCPFIEAECFKCKKLGHIASACRSRSKRFFRPREDRRNEQQTNTIVHHGVTIGDVFGTTANQKSVKPIIVEVQINGRPVDMELDTGSAVTILNEKTWKETLDRPKLQKSNNKLKSYSGHQIAVLGEVMAKVTVNQQTKVLTATVAGTSHNNLLGRDWLQVLKLDWAEIVAVNSVREGALTSLLQKYELVFKEELGHCKNIKAHIVLQPNAEPKFCKPRPIPYSIKEAVRAVRICGDFKVTVNPQIKVDQYPLPRPEELFASLNGGQQFTKLDFSEAYLQIELDEGGQECLVINTHKGLYRYKRLPFGVSSAPAIFQQVIDQVTQGLQGTACYMDDLLITGHNKEEHLKNLEAVLKRIEEYGFRIRKEKCLFLQDSVEYLGHIIDKLGVRPSPSKVEAILKAPKPENQMQLRSFLGGVTYFGKFIAQLSELSAPLNRLLRKDVPWNWDKAADEAFNKMKQALASMDVLVHYDPERSLGLACDASSVGVGAVLFHRFEDGTERPIA